LLQIGFCHFNGVPLVVKRSLVMGKRLDRRRLTLVDAASIILAFGTKGRRHHMNTEGEHR